MADDGLGDAAHGVAAGVALGEEPEHDPHVVGADHVLEHVEGERLEAGEALLAGEGGEVAEVLDQAAEVGAGEQGLGFLRGQALGAGGLGGLRPAATRMARRQRVGPGERRGRRVEGMAGVRARI